ncbi:MAG: VCBS repeat-containing protein, partial [Salinibacter sp.]
MWQQSAALQLQEAGPQSANYVMRAVNIGPPGVVRGDLSVGDVNGDDIPDVLVAGATQSADTTAQLYLGNGDGTFTEADADLMGVEFAATAMGDLDDDGNIDLVITGGVPDGFGTEPTTTVYYGNGDGTFSDGDTDLMGYTDGSVSIADVDEDGHEDILLTGEDENSETSVRLYLNDGDGSFSEADAGLTDVEAGASSIADVDGDGAPDLLLSGNFATGLYLNNGDGTFTEAGADLIEAQQSATAIADVDDDGHPDLLVAGEHFQSEKVAKLYLGDGEGDFTEADPGFEGVASGILETGDVDGDGHEDVLLAGATLGTDQPDDFVARLYLGDGNGSFEEAGAGLTGVARGGGAIADVDDDGDQDLFLAGVGKLYGWPSTRLYVNRTEQEGSNRSPEFAEIMDFLQEEPPRLAPGLSVDLPAEAGDLDGDEVTLSVGQGENISMDDAGNGTGTVTVAPERDQAGETIPVELDAEDPDGAVGTFSADVDVPGLLAAEEAGLSQVGYWSLSAGDVDGDGNLDVLATGEDDNQNETTLYLGTDDGTFVESEADLEGVQFGSSAIGDVNDDGEPDLVVTGVNDDNVPETTVYLNNGDGTFSEAGADLNGVRNGSVSIGDVDADGHPDVLLAGQAGEDFVPSATLYLGEGDGTFTESDAD